MAYMKDKSGKRLDKVKVARQQLAAPARPLHIANNCFGTGSSALTLQTTPGTSRVPHQVGADATDLQVVLGNHYTDMTLVTDGPATAAVAARAALEIGGVVYPLTFSGKRDVTIDGGGFATSDPLPITVAKGTTIYSRTYTSSTAYWATKRSHLNNGITGGFTATTDLTGAGAAAVTNAAASQYAPMAILGVTDGDATSTILIGDSIAHGYADGSDTNGFIGVAIGDLVRGGGGYLTRGLNGLGGIENLALNGDLARRFALPASHNKRLAFAQYATSAIIEYGRNDVSELQVYTTIGTNNLTLARMCKRRSLRVMATTVTPRTTSTDAWATPAGQAFDTSAMETIRVAYNTWLRAGAPMNPTTYAAVAVGTGGAVVVGDSVHPIDKVWDATALAESALNSGVWKVADRVVTDAAITTGTATLSSTSAAFTSADVGKSVVVAGAAAGGGVQQTIIRSVAGGVATLNSAAGTTVTGATCTIGALTFDGIHPNQWGALQMSAVVNVADLV